LEPIQKYLQALYDDLHDLIVELEYDVVNGKVTKRAEG